MRLSLLRNLKTQEYELFVCPKPKISQQKLLLKSQETPIGIVMIEGRFTDKWEKGEFNVLFNGTITVRKGNKIIYSAKLNFVFSYGD